MKNNSELNIKGHRLPITRLEMIVLSVVDGSLKVLLAKRGEAPYAGKWALPSGDLRVDLDQNLDAGAKRVMREQLGFAHAYLMQLCAVGGAKRDPGGAWALSVIYRVFANIDALQAISNRTIGASKWREVGQAVLDPLAFDHAALVGRAVNVTREEVEGMIMPRGLLAEHFTLTELQETCEQVLGHPIDKSSFRRKLADRSLVEPVKGAMRAGAFRPAQLYRLMNPRD